MIPDSKPALSPLSKYAQITKLAGFEYTKHFDYNVGGEIIALRSLNIREGKLDLSEVHTMPREVSDALPRSKLKSGDIVLGYVGSKLGNLALIEEDNRFHLAPNVALIRPRDGVDPHFLLMFMQSPFYQNQLWSLASSTGQPALSMANIRKSKIWLPSSREQKTIASMVSNWDRAIGTVEALIANARAHKRALMQQLLPQGTSPPQKRLPGFAGEWRAVSLADVLSVKRAKGRIVSTNEEGDGVPYIGSTSFLGEFSNYTTSEDALICVETDILVLWDGEYAGKVTTGLAGAVSSTVGRYRLAKAKADPVFIATLLENASERIRSIREGSGIPHMPGDFEHWFKFTLPPVAEQQAIAEVFKTNRMVTDQLETQLTALHQEKAALMQQLLAGKRPVAVEATVDA